MAEGGQLFFNDFTADRACILGGAVGCAGGVHPCVLDLRIVVLVGVGLEVRRQYHAARVGVLGHRKADGRAAVTATGAGRPARKDKACVRHGGHGPGSRALFDKLAGGAGQRAAVFSDKFQRDLGTAHGDGVFRDQVRGHAVRLRDAPQRLRAAVLSLVCVGAYISKIRFNGLFGEVYAV